MSVAPSVGLVVAAYLIGGISASMLLVRLRLGADVRQLGSGNAGATNVLRVLGAGSALVVLLCDVSKGAVAVAAARRLDAAGAVVGAVAVAAVLGHVYPIYHGFRGGKGVATAAGALGGLDPVPALVCCVVFVLVLVVTRYVALASMAGVGGFPLAAWVAGQWGWAPPPAAWLSISAMLIAALVIVKHGINLRRIRAGEEWRLGEAPPEEVGT